MNLSKHAIARSQQRGVPLEIIDLIAKYGTPKHRPGNALGYEISRKHANRLIQSLKRIIHRLERSADVVIIVSGDSPEEIITVYHKK